MNKRDYLIDSCSKLTKPEIAEFLETCSSKRKQVLIGMLNKRLKENDKDILLIYDRYRDRLAVQPIELEEILSCSSAERKRWCEQGYITVMRYDTIRKYGKDISYPVFDRYVISQITEKEIAQWRENHEIKKKANRLAAVSKRKNTRRNNDALRKDFKNNWNKSVNEWESIDHKLCITLQLAFWTMWISRWAKEYTKKFHNCTLRNYKSKYQDKKDSLYHMKRVAFELMLDSQFADVGIYIPQLRNPHKEYISFCDEHFADYNLYGFSWEERKSIYFEEDELQACPDCDYELEEHYYSLVHLKISDQRVDHKFSLHIPFPIIDYLLPNIDNIPRVVHNEQEGMFRFGRPLFTEEKIIFTEKYVINNFNDALRKYKSIMGKP